MSKAWFLFRADEYRGYVVHAETRGEAKAIGMRYSDIFFLDPQDWNYLHAHRHPALDDKPITIESLIESGIDMTFEGEPITELDIKCRCELCKAVLR
jgi:hypothetical protein